MKRLLIPLLLLMPSSSLAQEIVYETYEPDYPVYFIRWPHETPHGPAHVEALEADGALRAELGSSLMVLWPDGTLSTVFECGENCAVLDASVMHDGRRLLFSVIEEREPLPPNRRYDQFSGRSDVWMREVLSADELGEPIRLTNGNDDYRPPTGAGASGDPVEDFGGYGVYNASPIDIAGPKLMFTSNRWGYERKTPANISRITQPFWTHDIQNMQLFVMDEDGSNVENVTPMVLTAIVHPFQLIDGRIAIVIEESYGLRRPISWDVWLLNPDGTRFSPLTFMNGTMLTHGVTQSPDGGIIVCGYYVDRSLGLGTCMKIPQPFPMGLPAFHNVFPNENPGIRRSLRGHTSCEDGLGQESVIGTQQHTFTPRGMFALTEWTGPHDQQAACNPDSPREEDRVGKVGLPSMTPDGILLTRTLGPAIRGGRVGDGEQGEGLYYDTIDLGIWWSPDEITTSKRANNGLKVVVDDPEYHELQAGALVPYEAIYGQPEPNQLPWLPNDGTLHAELPPGTPYGIIGTSSVLKREEFAYRGSAGDGLAYFNRPETNHFDVGAKSSWYTDDDIYALRIVGMEPDAPTATNYRSYLGERRYIMGEIPLRRFHEDGSPVLDAEGNPDTSFSAKIPADTAFTFQVLNIDGEVLFEAPTSHQIRPGVVRVDCGGCHGHSQDPLPWEGSAASKEPPVNLYSETPLLKPGGELVVLDVPSLKVTCEDYIEPLMHRTIVDAGSMADFDFEAAIEANEVCDWWNNSGDSREPRPIPPERLTRPIPGNTSGWQRPNVSPWARVPMSRRSVGYWGIKGARADGKTNDDFPSDVTDPASDLDFEGPLVTDPPITADEAMWVARVIDLGLLSGPDAAMDVTRPPLTIYQPKRGMNDPAPACLMFGVTDAYSGVDESATSVTFSGFFFDGLVSRPPGQELRDLIEPMGEGRWKVCGGEQLCPAPGGCVPGEIPKLEDETFMVRVKDHAGNYHEVSRTFSTPGTVFIPPPTEDPDPEPEPDPDDPCELLKTDVLSLLEKHAGRCKAEAPK